MHMDTTSLYYFIELTKDLHMTRTAERLYISQQTLSNHISRLEKQLGCQLFERRPSLTLTYSGEQVLAFAERTVRDQINLQDILADVENQKRGSIRFGASTLRMNACLPVILPKFSAEYPYIELQITDQTSRRLEPMILDGDLDFALVAGKEGTTAPAAGGKSTKEASSAGGKGYKKAKKEKSETDASPLVRELLIRDPVYLCAAEKVLESYLGENTQQVIAKSREGAYVSDFRKVPFLLFQNRMGLLIQRCFEEAGFEPHAYIKGPYTQVITRIGFQGTAAFFSTGVVLSSQPDKIPENLHVFPLLYRGKPLYQEIYLVYTRNRYITRYAARFLELLRECFRDIEHHPVEDGAK